MDLTNEIFDDLFEQFNQKADGNDKQTKENGSTAERMAAADTEKTRHLCEVVSIGRMFREKGAESVRSYLLKVEKARGTAAAERLRCEAWEEIQKAKGAQT